MSNYKVATPLKIMFNLENSKCPAEVKGGLSADGRGCWPAAGRKRQRTRGQGQVA